jgi:hypothetical protein
MVLGHWKWFSLALAQALQNRARTGVPGGAAPAGVVDAPDAGVGFSDNSRSKKDHCLLKLSLASGATPTGRGSENQSSPDN